MKIKGMLNIHPDQSAPICWHVLWILSLLLLVVILVHPNKVTANVTMMDYQHAVINEYFTQDSDAHQACVDFATSHGYPPNDYCWHSWQYQEWGAGNLCENFALRYSSSCRFWYIGYFHYNYQCPSGQNVNRDTGACELPVKSNGEGGCGVDFGNPINGSTGNKWLHELDFVDRSLNLTFDRYYNTSVTASSNALGSGWGHTYDRSISVYSLGAWVTVRRQDGKAYNFKWNAGVWVPDADVSDRLDELKSSDGTRTGWHYTTADQTVESYDAAGKLQVIVDRTGYTQILSYSDTSTPTNIAPVGGLLLRVTDSFGRELQFSYDADSRLSALTAPDGRLFQYAYDVDNNLSSVTYPDKTTDDPTDNPKKSYVYGNDTRELANTANVNRPHTLVGVIDENGARYGTYRYDAQGRAISTEHAGGVEKYSLNFNSNGYQTSITDPLGSVRTSNFTTILGVVKSTGSDQPAGSGCAASASHLGYDANGNIASRTDFNGNLGCYAYDLSRNLETVRVEGLAAGSTCPADLAAYTPTGSQRKVTTQWHAAYRLPTQIDQANQRSTFGYDANGNLLSKTLTDTATQQSRTWTYTYNALGQILTADGPRTDVNDVTTYTYYADTTASHHPGDLHTVSNALGHTTTFTDYDANGRLLSLTDPNGLVVSFAYDPRGRLTHKTVDGHATTYDYDNVGNLIQVTRPSGVYYRFTYDAAHRLTDITDALSGKIHYTLDNMGNRTQEDILDANGNVLKTHSRVYDALNRLAQDIGAYNQTTQYAYDPNGNLTQITDAAGHTTQQQYDSLDRLIRGTDALAGQTDYDYDALDRLTQVTDANNHSTTYSYNGLGDLLQLDSPNTGVTQYAYDSAGNLSQKTDAGNTTASYQYDALDRLLGIDYPGTEADVDNGYDGTAQGLTGQIGRLTSAGRGGHTDRYSYDLRGNLATASAQALAHPDAGDTVTYRYNADEQLSDIDYSTYRTIHYDFGQTGRPLQITVTDYDTGQYASNGYNLTRNLASDIAYLPFGPLQGLNYGNGLSLSKQYDRDYRLTGQTVGSVQQLTYGYDAGGNLQTLSDLLHPGNDESYFYDPLDRLYIRVFNDSTGLTKNVYLYDAVGNRTVKYQAGATQYNYDLNSQKLLSIETAQQSAPLVFNAVGNVTQASGKTYVYAADQRLDAVTQGASTLAQYTYDTQGQRTRKMFATGAVTGYDYMPQGYLLAESGPQLTTNYVYLDGEPLARVDYDLTDTTGNVAAWNIAYYHNNPVGAPLQTTDRLGQISWSAQLDPFGKATPINPTITQNLRFPGQYYDQETGLHYNMARYYDPDNGGRYLQSDPIGLSGGINTYAYVGNNPLRYIDPLGLDRTYAVGQRLVTFPDGQMTPAESAIVQAGFPEADGPVSPVGVAATTGEAALAACPPGRVARGGLSSSANFAQRTFREGFSAGGRRELSAIAGQPIRTVDDLANAIRGGLEPSKIPVNVIERGGNTLILNTRTVQALERAGVPRSSFNVINRTGDEFFEGLLSGQLQHNNLTSGGISSVVRE